VSDAPSSDIAGIIVDSLKYTCTYTLLRQLSLPMVCRVDVDDALTAIIILQRNSGLGSSWCCIALAVGCSSSILAVDTSVSVDHRLLGHRTMCHSHRVFIGVQILRHLPLHALVIKWRSCMLCEACEPEDHSWILKKEVTTSSMNS